MSQKCFPFIVGCGRSGTTLLRAMIDSNPEIAVPAETKFVARMGRDRRKYERPSGFSVGAFVDDVYRLTDRNARWRMRKSDVAAAFASAPPTDYPDAVRRLFSAMAAARGKKRYGNKTPIHVMTLPLLAGIFPEARFVHVIRDGRDVALSYFETEFGPTTVTQAALHWRRHVRTGRASGRRLGDERYIEVRYEDLVREPETVLQSLCTFLDLDFDRAMLDYHERADDVIGGIKLPQYHLRVALPPTKRRDWRREMRPIDIARFETIAGSLLVELGYERAFPKVRLRVAGGAMRSAVGDELGRRMGAFAGRLKASWR